MPTGIWKSRLRSGSAHCDLEVAVEVRKEEAAGEEAEEAEVEAEDAEEEEEEEKQLW